MKRVTSAKGKCPFTWISAFNQLFLPFTKQPGWEPPALPQRPDSVPLKKVMLSGKHDMC